MSLPLAKLDLLLGYGIAFAALQASLTSLVAFGALGLETDGPVWLIAVKLVRASACSGAQCTQVRSSVAV